MQLVAVIREAAKNDYSCNRILLSYNPILLIALCSEYLDRIASYIHVFKHDCTVIKNRLLGLGAKIVEHMTYETIERVFMDSEYRQRTVLHLITSRGLHCLLQNPKINTLLDQIWIGKDSFRCDGRLRDFSSLTHLATAKLTRLPYEEMGMFELF